MKTDWRARLPLAGYTVGLEGFAKISAVEGLRITRDIRNDFLEFDKQNLSPDARRAALAKKYGRAKTHDRRPL